MSKRVTIVLSDENYEYVKDNGNVSGTINEIIKQAIYEEKNKLRYKLNFMDRELQQALLLLYTMAEKMEINDLEQYNNKPLFKEAKQIIKDTMSKNKNAK